MSDGSDPTALEDSEFLDHYLDNSLQVSMGSDKTTPTPDSHVEKPRLVTLPSKSGDRQHASGMVGSSAAGGWSKGFLQKKVGTATEKSPTKSFVGTENPSSSVDAGVEVSGKATSAVVAETKGGTIATCASSAAQTPAAGAEQSIGSSSQPTAFTGSVFERAPAAVVGPSTSSAKAPGAGQVLLGPKKR